MTVFQKASKGQGNKLTQTLRFEVAGHTSVGVVRKANEDSIDWFQSPSGDVVLAVVADGMGGHAGGAKASQTAIEVFVATLAPGLAKKKLLSLEQIEQSMYQAGVEAHNAIHLAKLGNPDFLKMGTTIVGLWIQGSTASILHVGDSRCYRIRESEGATDIQQLTRDDSVVQTMVEEGTLAAAEAEMSPYRNMLTQAIGSDGDILLNQLETDVEVGDLFLLCSDGLYNEMTNSQIVRLLEEFDGLQPPLSTNTSLNRAAYKLVEAAIEAGGHDNISVVLVRVY